MGDVDWGGLLLLGLVLWFADRTPRVSTVVPQRRSWRDLFARSPRTDP